MTMPRRMINGNQGLNSRPTAAAPARPRLGDLLCRRGLITSTQLEIALDHQRTKAPDTQLGKILVEMNMIRPEDVAEVLAESVGIPYVVLDATMVQSPAIDCLPREFIEQHNLLPLSLNDGRLHVAVEQFTDLYLIDEIRRRAGNQVQVIAAEAENIRRTRAAALPGNGFKTPEVPNKGLDDILDQIGVDDLKLVEYEPSVDESDLVATATESPVVKLVNYIIQMAVDAGASDIHIEPEDGNFRVRYRIDGDLGETVRPDGRLLPAVVSRIKIMAGMDISERRLPQDGSMTVTRDDRPIDLRVSTMSTRFGEKVVLRIVDRMAAIRGLDSLGFDADMLAKFRLVVQEANGIVLVTGPTGSGKTTTLYGALAELVSVKHNISTIEDPVERRLAGTNQFQVNPGAGFTFASALRSLLRQDPDIIMVGEIRDPETAKLATEAALTGHLVLSTLHTNDAATAIPRLVNMGVEAYLVAASLRGVLAQRLVRKLCVHCRKCSALTGAERETLIQLCGNELPHEIMRSGAGCEKCRSTGYIGRIGVFELLLFNEELLSAIAHHPTVQAVRERMTLDGLRTLLDDGLAKVRRGLIEVEGLLEMVSRTDELISGRQALRPAA